MLLVIDTSTRYAGVALASESRILQAAHWRSRQNHSVELLPTIDSLLQRESISVEELTGVAVAIGPGGFSALRVGISAAKGIAWSSTLPLVAATTLEMEAFPYLQAGLPVCAVLDAGRGQVSWALFESHRDGLAQTSEEAIAAPQEVLQSLSNPSILCGEALELHREAFTSAMPPHVKPAFPYLPGQRLLSLAYLGLSKLQAGLTVDVLSVQPLYLRRPTITEPRC